MGLHSNRLFTEVEVVKPEHLEIVAAHLVGKVMTPYKFCAQKGPRSKGYFTECIMLPEALDYASFGGRCTNCAFQGVKCSHEELSGGKKAK